jgi:hypothetical protein
MQNKQKRVSHLNALFLFLKNLKNKNYALHHIISRFCA